MKLQKIVSFKDTSIKGNVMGRAEAEQLEYDNNWDEAGDMWEGLDLYNEND